MVNVELEFKPGLSDSAVYSSGSPLHFLAFASPPSFLSPLLISCMVPLHQVQSSPIPVTLFPLTPTPWPYSTPQTHQRLHIPVLDQLPALFPLRLHSKPDSVVFSPVFLAPRVLYKTPHFISDPGPPKRSKGSNEKREVLDSGDDVWSRTGASSEGTKREEEKWKSTPQWVAVTRSVRSVSQSETSPWLGGALSTPWIKACHCSPDRGANKSSRSFQNQLVSY